MEDHSHLDIARPYEMFSAFATVFILCSQIVFISSEEWIVNTENGAIRGFWSDQYKVWRFVGIPYAQSPLGELRYKAPQPPIPWSGILNATNDYTVCTQVTGRDVTVTEDCLLINVFVPDSVKNRPHRPVLFFTHGGGFVSGDGIATYNPYLTTRYNIILVTFNYRLGPMGYTCLGTERIPGNAALKDFVAALEWVSKNIARFGGNPEAVTLYGQSAGAVQVDSLLYINKANQFFQQVILESGSTFAHNTFSYSREGIAKAIALDLGLKHTDDLEELQSFYDTAPAIDLVYNFHRSVLNTNTNLRNRLNLCIERNLKDAIITKPFRYPQMSGDYYKVPVLLAYAELDGLHYAGEFDDIIDELNSEFYKFLPYDIWVPYAERDSVVNRIKETYFGGQTISEKSLHDYILYKTDTFTYGLYAAAMQYSSQSTNPVYLMEFSYRGGYSTPSLFPEFSKAIHSDLLAYVMDLGYNNNATRKDETMRDTVTEMWANFVKSGDPTPDSSLLPMRWTQFTPDKQHYLKIDQDITIHQFPNPDRFQLWAEIYKKYYYDPPVFEDY